MAITVHNPDSTGPDAETATEGLSDGEIAAWAGIPVSVAVDLAPEGIRVNGISPGPIPTEVFMEFLGLKDEDLPGMGEKLNIPLGRLGAPEDISPAVVYLASNASSWMTGQT
ncbi:MAG: SDR family NAD(P)-dependent oxidoreductase, partial [Alphaproteobacteria bacterium]